MPNAWRAKLPYELPLHSTTEGCLGQDLQDWGISCWCGDSILGFEPISITMSKEQYAFLLAPCLASLAQQIPICFSPEASTVGLPTCAVQPLQKHFPFTGWLHVWNRSLRSRPASCASSVLQVNEEAPSWCSKYWSNCKTNLICQRCCLDIARLLPEDKYKLRHFYSAKRIRVTEWKISSSWRIEMMQSA